jgi:hypothetical protein
LLEIIQFCIDHGCNVFEVDRYGRTALDWAKADAFERGRQSNYSENKLCAIEYLESMMYKCAIRMHEELGPGF